jgi:FtsP/CotA-like multicopper oxidase with cupredoxin domain
MFDMHTNIDLSAIDIISSSSRPWENLSKFKQLNLIFKIKHSRIPKVAQLKPFQDDLPIPDVIKPSSTGKLFISAVAHKVKLHSDLPEAEVWSYRAGDPDVVQQGSGTTYLGPTVEVMRGDKVEVEWRNEIKPSSVSTAQLPFEVVKVPYTDGKTPVPENTPGKLDALPDEQDESRPKLRNLEAALVTHLHGGRTQADFDGWPDNVRIPDQSANYIYQNDQAATMLWYHDHAIHVTRLNVYAGLAGAWLIRDDEEQQLQLPNYQYEIPLVIQDRNLDTNPDDTFSGALLHKTEVQDGPAEFFGPFTLVNGKIWPKADVEPRLYRFRVLNGSNARTYRLLLLDNLGNTQSNVIWQIGSDQGLMQNKVPFPEDGLILAPAERVDLLVNFADFSGKNLYLWNTAEAPFGDNAKAEPSAEQVKQELASLLGNPFASAKTVTNDEKSSELNRRLFPQVMRFDVGCHAQSDSHTIPSDPLWSTERSALEIKPETPIRLMTLVEKGPSSSAPDATSMLVFWEYVRVADNPAPPGSDGLLFTYWHPGLGAFKTELFAKAAEEFDDRVNWHVHLNETELWYIVNVSADTHPIHVHLVEMKVHERYSFDIKGWNAGGDRISDSTQPIEGNTDVLTEITATTKVPIDPSVSGPKDTVRVNPGEMVGVAMKFSPFSGRYMYHCHILEHEDHDMMRPFTVVPKGIPHHHQ